MTTTIKKIIISMLLAASSFSALAQQVAAAAFSWEDHYKIASVPSPRMVDTQVGGLAFTKDGRIAACFHRGEIMFYNPEAESWKLFASGLHEPLGIYAEDGGTILVVQRAELTRLHDKDGDGTADFYEVICNDWGVSGNYHEFTFGLVKDSKKNVYVSLGTASNGSGVREEIRGPWNDTGGLTQKVASQILDIKKSQLFFTRPIEFTDLGIIFGPPESEFHSEVFSDDLKLGVFESLEGVPNGAGSIHTRNSS